MTVAGPRRLFTGLPFYALAGTESIFYSVVRKKGFLSRFAEGVKGTAFSRGCDAPAASVANVINANRRS
jgi:hypothetical protein